MRDGIKHVLMVHCFTVILVCASFYGILSDSQKDTNRKYDYRYMATPVGEWTSRDMYDFYSHPDPKYVSDETTDLILDLTALAVMRSHIEIGTPLFYRMVVKFSLKTESAYAATFGVTDGGYVIVVAYNLDAISTMPRDEIAGIVAHEMAHVVDFISVVNNGHGEVWKRNCKKLMPTAKCNAYYERSH